MNMMIRYTQQQVLVSTNIGILLLLVITLTISILKWRTDWELTRIIPSAVTITAVNQNAALIEQLPELHVFGEPLQAVSDVPISSLEFHVTGIAKITTQPDTVASKAYISISNQPSKIFRVGDTISSGIKLYDVTDDAVVLENNGRLEKLPLVRNKLEFKPRPSKEIK